MISTLSVSIRVQGPYTDGERVCLTSVRVSQSRQAALSRVTISRCEGWRNQTQIEGCQ